MREKIKNPRREDEYGTSVMGIQFNKEGLCTVSIKNRYNHSVNNPDATYGNDLEKIAPGLTQSFSKLLLTRNLLLNNTNVETFQIPGYVVANDGKYYKYNMEQNGVYYCPGNIIIENGQKNKIENPEKKILIDNFILDIENKSLQLYDKNDMDSFEDDFKDIDKIEIKKSIESTDAIKIISIQKKGQDSPIIIKLNKDNEIIGYENNSLIQVGDSFLHSNQKITEFKLPNLKQTGNSFLYSNNELTELDLPNLIQVENNFLNKNEILEKLNLPKLEKTGNYCLYNNKELTELILPSLTETGINCVCTNTKITKIKVPNLKKEGSGFFNSIPNETKSQMMGKINSTVIAELDKNNNITSHEVDWAKIIMETVITKDKSRGMTK